ncbi:hypothetical protein [Streptomyces sp. NPDC018833]|uniref:hypothetical protein n=1 Tax=Streptomyces sp. NPDC018833 TaxID=3365053 RepID=UPI003793CA49
MSEFTRRGRIFKVWSFDVSHRRLILRSDPAAIDNTTTRVEIYFEHVEFMLLKPVYRSGIHVRPATSTEFEEVARFAELEADARTWTWMLEEEGRSCVVSSVPSWREAPRPYAAPSLFSASEPWPLGPDVTFGSVRSEEE